MAPSNEFGVSGSGSVGGEPDILREIHAQAKNAPQTDEIGYTIPNTYLGARRPIKVLIIGFGAAAINLVHILGKTSDPGSNISIQCYEKNPEVGGTWYENRYPGCACDIVSQPCESGSTRRLIHVLSPPSITSSRGILNRTGRVTMQRRRRSMATSKTSSQHTISRAL